MSLFLAALGLCCFRGFSLLAVSKGYPVVTVHELVILVGSLVAMRGLCVCSVVVTPQLYSAESSCVAYRLSCCQACGNFPDQGPNLCALH